VRAGGGLGKGKGSGGKPTPKGGEVVLTEQPGVILPMKKGFQFFEGHRWEGHQR